MLVHTFPDLLKKIVFDMVGQTTSLHTFLATLKVGLVAQLYICEHHARVC